MTVMKARRCKNAPFWHHWKGGGGGGRGGPDVPFILSKIVTSHVRFSPLSSQVYVPPREEFTRRGALVPFLLSLPLKSSKRVTVTASRVTCHTLRHTHSRARSSLVLHLRGKERLLAAVYFNGKPPFAKQIAVVYRATWPMIACDQASAVRVWPRL